MIKRKVILVLVLVMAAWLTLTPTRAAENVSALPCALQALLTPPSMEIPRLTAAPAKGALPSPVLAQTSPRCDYAHQDCMTKWQSDYYQSCLYLNGGNDGGPIYDSCQCKSNRLYMGCMRAWGCETKGYAMLSSFAHEYCLTPQ